MLVTDQVGLRLFLYSRPKTDPPLVRVYAISPKGDVYVYGATAYFNPTHQTYRSIIYQYDYELLAAGYREVPNTTAFPANWAVMQPADIQQILNS